MTPPAKTQSTSTSATYGVGGGPPRTADGFLPSFTEFFFFGYLFLFLVAKTWGGSGDLVVH